MIPQLQCQQVVGRLATTQEQAVTRERHDAVRTAVSLLGNDSPIARAAAFDHLARSVQRQARMSGIPGVDLLGEGEPS